MTGRSASEHRHGARSRREVSGRRCTSHFRHNAACKYELDRWKRRWKLKSGSKVKTDAHGPCTISRTPAHRTPRANVHTPPTAYRLHSDTRCTHFAPCKVRPRAYRSGKHSYQTPHTHHTQTPLVRPATGRQRATAATACCAPHASQSHALRRTAHGARRARPDAQDRSAGL